MSYQATNWAKKQSTRSIEPRGHACKLLLMVLADYVRHDTGIASVTIGELSKASQMVKSTVHENLRKLENIGLITRMPKTSIYRTPGFKMGGVIKPPRKEQPIGKHGADTPEDTEKPNPTGALPYWQRPSFIRNGVPV